MQDHIKFLKEEMTPLLQSIPLDQKPNWGIMTPHHLIEHIGMLLAISNGKVAAPSFFPPEKQNKYKRIFFEEKPPFPKNFNPLKTSTLAPPRYDTPTLSLKKYEEQLERFFDYFENNPTAKPNHPVHGILNYEEWCEFHHRHFLHHWEQFMGVSSDEA